MTAIKDLFSFKAWQWRVNRRLRPVFRKDWPARTGGAATRRPRIAVVTVNYNTAPLLARLVFSLRRITDDNVEIGPIVVVDNNSTDGSVEFLKKMDEAGAITAVLNRRQKYHGPGLNQGMELLLQNARSGKPGFTDIDYVFVVDSDVFICRGEVFSDAIKAMHAVRSPMAGEFEPNEYIAGGYSHVSSLLFDPVLLWRRGFHPFEEHGVPALEFQRTVIKNRQTRLDFPFRTHLYLIHLWSGTLKAICSANEKDNKYFDWASADLPKRSSLDQKTEYVLEEFEQLFRTAVPNFEPTAVAAACTEASRLRLKRPYEVAPATPFSPSGTISDDGFVAR